MDDLEMYRSDDTQETKSVSSPPARDMTRDFAFVLAELNKIRKALSANERRIRILDRKVASLEARLRMSKKA